MVRIAGVAPPFEVEDDGLGVERVERRAVVELDALAQGKGIRAPPSSGSGTSAASQGANSTPSRGYCSKLSKM